MLQRMKQRFRNSSPTTSTSTEGGVKVEVEEEEKEEDYNNYFGEDELEVAEILLQLPHLIVQSNITYPPLYTWGTKRKRSALEPEEEPPSPPPQPMLPCPPQTTHHLLLPPPSGNKSDGVITTIVPKVESNSPKTPLSFSPSESDSKPTTNKRRKQQQHQQQQQLSHHKKKTKEEWQTDVSTLLNQQETLKKELRKVMDYYESEKAKNLKLRSTIRMVQNHLQQGGDNGVILNSSVRIQGNNNNSNDNGLLLDLGLRPQGPTLQVVREHQPSLPMVVSHGRQPMNCRSEITDPTCPRYSTSSSSGVAENLGPRGIPDLNFAAAGGGADETNTASPGGIHNSMISNSSSSGFDYFQTFDMNKAAEAAQARRRRIEMKKEKVKKSMASIKPRLQTR